ncbi:tripartite tricarboxylate transporter TctB family protein [Microbacterium radiodurans]|uniref:Tripartite tricarboxylate transporter TctB family protein n=1 Tax=Microbacterium radiodurans TaxID=661398 RepID=A0A5J5IVL5_9MICO|nr:tripartite tricarboxylate transporter TctB family protein [Microbacterium radiodurans]KAA9087082.1 tripartite tricarboxylate transporter TctB family protein [Microbacterium radiodurans]
MSIEEPPTLTTGALRVQRLPRWYTGRSELIIVAGVLLLAGALTVGTVTMEVPEGAAFPGPTFFPILVSVFLYAVGVALAIDVLRSPKRSHVAEDPTEISDEMLQDLGGIDATSEIRVVSPEAVTVPATSDRGGLDVRTLLIVVAALALFIVALPILGWLISAAALFWVLAWAFGSRRPLLDIGVAVIASSILQLAFGAGLGLPLPAGILEGVLSWIS